MPDSKPVTDGGNMFPPPYGMRTMATSLAIALVLGCGNDAAEPAPLDVSGLYQAVSQPDPASCDPATATGILEPVLGAIPLRLSVRVEQLNDQVRLTALAAQGLDGRPVTLADQQPLVGALGADGSVQFTTHLTSHYTLEGRTFVEDASFSISGRFDLEANPMAFSLASQGQRVVREDDANAPVFATCTSSETTIAVRTAEPS